MVLRFHMFSRFWKASASRPEFEIENKVRRALFFFNVSKLHSCFIQERDVEHRLCFHLIWIPYYTGSLSETDVAYFIYQTHHPILPSNVVDGLDVIVDDEDPLKLIF